MLRFQSVCSATCKLMIPAVFALQLAQGQTQGGGGAGRTGGAGAGGNTNTNTGSPGLGTGTRGNLPGMTTTTPGNNPNIYSPDTTRPIFLSGRVLLDDGNKPGPDIAIQRVCNGNPHTETHTDSRGHFSFQFGGSSEVPVDASESSAGGIGPMRGNAQNTPGWDGAGSRGGLRDFQRCSIQASYPGYRSDVIDLFQRRALDNPDIGIIVLHRLGNIKGTSISMTSELAPKKAKKDLEKAEQLLAKEKVDEARQHLESAVELYPKYAVAWYELGRIQVSGHDFASARKSFESAIAADAKYVNPYDAIAGIAVQESKWQEAADRSKQAVDLNPVEFPSAWLYNAFANYNLKNFPAAEKSASEVAKLDGAHRFAQVETLLAQLCADRGDYAGAAQHLQTFLNLAPNSPNAPALKQQLAKIQETLAATKK